MQPQPTPQVRREGYGRWTERDDDLFSVLGLGEYDDELPEGRWSYWYETGQREADGIWVGGRKHGAWVHWTLEGAIDEGLSGQYSGGHRVRALSVLEQRRMAVREGCLERCMSCGSIKADRLTELGWDTGFFAGSDRDGALCKWCLLATMIFEQLDRHMASIEVVGVMETMDLVGSRIEHVFGPGYARNLERLRALQEAHDQAVTRDWRRLHRDYLRETYGDEQDPALPPRADGSGGARLIRLIDELGWGPGR